MDIDPSAGISLQELQLAARNHAMPLEALRYDVTPVGLHYVLVHYDIPVVDADAWRLHIDGRVDRPLVLGLDDQAGVLDDAVEVVFTGLDRGVEGEVDQRYARSLPLAEALLDDVLLAYDLNGGPLPPQHGYPLRVVVRGWYGMTSVKWLERVTVLSHEFDGYQNRQGYRLRQAEDEDGEPVTRMRPRGLMAPPGIPEFLSRERFLDGPTVLEGRAWSGWAPITRVEVSTDGGATWADADLDEQPAPRAWARWSYEWAPTSVGRHELACRAHDAAGNAQPLEPPWNLGGYANNGVQRIAVTARGF